MAIRDTVRRKLTYEDYVLFPEDGQRHEIIDGEHYVSPAPIPKHQKASMRLSIRVGGFVEIHELGEVYAAPIDVLLSRHDVLQPDLLFISNERAAILKDKNIQGAPDLVIEILSESTRKLDEDLKLGRYELLGVREYWIVDPREEQAYVYRVQGEGFRMVAELSAEAGDVLTTPLLPGLEIPLRELFQ
ncbi:MAG TPA: Uma2 family endonuclease [Thermoanaerobaculia bacterium]|nr:Uma2 family endonuclease [Thermoanaerobaculia bacterium]